ncbi:MAG: BMC domain-containing protein [Phycisphaerae bacterium]
MTFQPALALLETDSVALGTQTADAMVKRAPIDVFRTGTVQPGKYLILVGGSVAAVEEAYREGLHWGKPSITDEIFLPDVHRQVYESVQGKRRPNRGDALGVIELSSIPSVVRSADRAVKAAHVSIVDLRLGDGLGGKGIVQLVGKLEAIQAAVASGLDSITHPDVVVRSAIIPTQHAELRERIDKTSTFAD